VTTGWLFVHGYLNALTQTMSWSVIFFLASAGASSAYLTMSEIFPLETRAVAIAFFYALGTALGGVFGPVFFSLLIQSDQALSVFYGDVVGAVFMAGVGVVALFWAVEAENEALEKIAPSLEEILEKEEGVNLDMAHKLEVLQKEEYKEEE
jgi:MFS family permease